MLISSCTYELFDRRINSYLRLFMSVADLEGHFHLNFYAIFGGNWSNSRFAFPLEVGTPLFEIFFTNFLKRWQNKSLNNLFTYNLLELDILKVMTNIKIIV